MRAGEVLGMQLADVDLTRGLATVRRGKGGKGRVVPFGPQTAAAIDRYMRPGVPTGWPTPGRCGSVGEARRSATTG